jgi:hypothetical protein
MRVVAKRALSRVAAITEFCKDCGREQPVVWTSPDWLWAAVTERADGGGVLCPDCFDRRASAQGRMLRWVPEQETHRLTPRRDGFQPFRAVSFAVWCSSCGAEMPRDQWPSHYRTKGHRESKDRAAA